MRRLPKSIRDILAQLEPQVSAAFLAVINNIRRISNPMAIANQIESGNVEFAVRLLRLEVSLFGALDRALEEAYRAGGAGAIASLPVILDPADGGRVVLGFDGRHPRAEQWAREMSSRLIVGIVDEQRNMARRVIREGLMAGRGPRNTALDLVGRIGPSGRREGGFIGLTDAQARWVQNARAELLEGRFGAYRARDLRQVGLDRLIGKIEREGRLPTEAEVNRIITAYQNNVLRYRAETIARTETITSLRAGRHEGFAQLVDTGAIRSDQIVREWRSTGDARTRDTHQEFDGETIQGIETLWNVNGSRMLYPGDTSHGAAPAESINCRCYEEFRINYEAVV